MIKNFIKRIKMVRRIKKWFKPKKDLHGWDKDLSTTVRRRRASIGRTDLSSAKALQALANVSKDAKTRRVAAVDARFFYARHKRLGFW